MNEKFSFSNSSATTKPTIREDILHHEPNTNNSKYVEKERNYESLNAQQNYPQHNYQSHKYQAQHNNSTRMQQQPGSFSQTNQGYLQYNMYTQQQQQQQQTRGFYQNYNQQQYPGMNMNANNFYNSQPYYSK